MRVGIKDVAAKAGVSISTVSYVMSGKRSISEETARRVRQAADDLGYVPRAARNAGGGAGMSGTSAGRGAAGTGIYGVASAGAVANGTRRGAAAYGASAYGPAGNGGADGRAPTNVLAISAPVRGQTDLSNYAVFFFALATAAKKYGYDILLLMDERADRELVRVANEHLVDGVFLLDVEIDDSRADVAASLPVPVVSVGYPANHDAVYAIDSDFAAMGREAVNVAHGLGHRHLLLAGGVEPALQAGANYLSRFVEGVRERSEELDVELTVMFTSGSGIDDATLVVDSAFGADSGISAIVCAETTPLAGALIGALRQRGKSVPGDVSLLLAMNASGTGQLPRAVDEMPMNPNAVCRRAVETMVAALEGSRRDVGSVELLPFEYRAHGTMTAR